MLPMAVARSSSSGLTKSRYLYGTGAVLGIFIWVGQSKAKQILGRLTEVAYVGIMGMTRAVWVDQERLWVGQ